MLADICVSLFEMLALVFVFFKSHNTWWVSARYYEKKNLNKKLSIFTPCNTLKGGHYQKWAHLGFACAGPWSGGLGPYPTHNSQVLWRNMMVVERELWAPAFAT